MRADYTKTASTTSSLYVGQAEIAALESIGQPLVIDA